jgi:hypothetical protein
MNTSTTQARNFRPKVGKIAMAVALASAIGGLGVTPAFGDETDHRDNRDNRGRYAQDRGHNADRARHDYRGASHHPYQYAQPVYAPPPVYYAPQPSPGISLFFPITIR